MEDKGPTLCSLCYGPLEKKLPTAHTFILKQGTTLRLCSPCNHQAEEISQRAGVGKQAAIAYMINLIFTALTSSTPGRSSRT